MDRDTSRRAREAAGKEVRGVRERARSGIAGQDGDTDRERKIDREVGGESR